MKICATYGTEVPLDHRADLQEIRMDVFDDFPNDMNENFIITLCGKDISDIPVTFNGLLDIGNNNVHTEFRTIKSIHDFCKTPTSEEIVQLLKDGKQEISKGAFTATSFRDLASVLDASRSLYRKHVLLCMGDLGRITRIRQNILGNEFTFGYSGEPTAPGQFSLDELRSLNDECTIVGIIGHPLGHSKSPAMHNAAMVAGGINGIYLPFDSADLDRVEDVIRGYDIRGVNVTIPYKQRIIDHIDSVSPTAEKVGAVNTIVNDNGELIGENTDVLGISDSIKDVCTKDQNVLIMGSGGAARAAVYAFTEFGCTVSISGRNHGTMKEICKELGPNDFNGDLDSYDAIVNCTPIGIVDGEYPIDINQLRTEQIVFDMVYGRRTPLLDIAKRKGCRIINGEDMLVNQGAASFRLWFGNDPDINVMRGALN